MKEFFDLLIAILIFITAFPAVILLYSVYKRKTSWEFKHFKTTKIFVGFLLVCLFLLTYGSFVEPQLLITDNQTTDLPNITKPIKIAFISDLHVGKYKQTEWAEKVVNRVLALQPDLVLLGGDQVDNENYMPVEFTYLAPLKQLADKIPTYAINGNHEYGIGSGKPVKDPLFRVADIHAEAKTALENFGIKYLVNDTVKLNINSSTIYLFGGDEYWSDKLNFTSILKEKTVSSTVIGLIHNPSFIAKPYPQVFDLILSGHTHGGQIRLPFIGPLGTVDDFLPHNYYQGLHQLSPKTQIFVSRGAGETAARARLFDPPEIALITLK